MGAAMDAAAGARVRSSGDPGRQTPAEHGDTDVTCQRYEWPMRMSDESSDETQYLRLLQELDRLEGEQRVLNLRDPREVDACRRKIAALRTRITEYLRSRAEK